METRKHLAAEKKRCGSHNCAQAIVCTYADRTCGALVGAGIVLGMATKDKALSMKAMRQVMTQFQQRNGATQCWLLKGVGTKEPLRECPDCVADAAEFLEAQLSE